MLRSLVNRLRLRACESWGADGNGHMYWRADIDGKQVTDGPMISVIDEAINAPRGWVVSCWAALTDGDGNEWIEEEVLKITEPFLLNDLRGEIDAARERVKLFGFVNDAGWVARSYTIRNEKRLAA